MKKSPIDEGTAVFLPLEDYLMIRYIANTEGTTPASLITSWLLGYLDAKKNEEKNNCNNKGFHFFGSLFSIGIIRISSASFIIIRYTSFTVYPFFARIDSRRSFV